MSYIKLGNTKINYGVKEDTFIITSIIETQSSYQYPVLVRDKTTLDIYFGKSFLQRGYYEELLDLGATLFLYKPISKITPTENPDIPEDLLPEYIPDDPKMFPDNFIIPENSKSWNNRSTLRLINPNVYQEYSYNYCYPEYGREYSDMSSITSVGSIDTDRLELDYGTLAFTIDFSKVESFFNPGVYQVNKRHEFNYYITLPVNGANYMIWFDSRIGSEPVSQQYVGSNYVGIDLYLDKKGTVKKSINQVINEFIGIVTRPLNISDAGLPGLGYTIDPYLSSDLKYVIYKRSQEPSNYFYNLPGLNLDINMKKTQDILSEGCENIKQLEFYSKIIGVNEENIKVKIENLPYYIGSKYRITISIFDYEEVYEVNLNDIPDKNGEIHPLETTINKSSRLVRCHLPDRINPLPTGEWELKGAVTEEYTYVERRSSLEVLLESEIVDDVLIIDDLELWKSGDKISKDDLELFLEYSRNKDNQSLITNKSYKYLDEEGTEKRYDQFRYNLIDDDNRLVYFYNDMTYLGYWRPSYYVFLNGLLTDIYSAESLRIKYELPSDDVMTIMKENKCNYLVYNNHYYYYQDYFDENSEGNYNVEIITRFIISKVGRDFRRNKWKIISHQGYNRIRESNNIIDKLLSRYSIIRSLEIVSTEDQDNTFYIRLELKLGTLVKNNLFLDVELNYKDKEN